MSPPIIADVLGLELLLLQILSYERAIFNTGIPILGGSILKLSILENGPMLPSLVASDMHLIVLTDHRVLKHSYSIVTASSFLAQIYRLELITSCK